MKVNGIPNFRTDILKWIVVILLISSALGFNYYVVQSIVPKIVTWIIVIGVSLLIIFQTNQKDQLYSLIKQSWIELQKVVWPTRQETIQTTIVVISMVAVVSLLLWFVDGLLIWIIGILTGQRG